MKPEQFIREYGAEKAREEFEKSSNAKISCPSLPFVKTSSYEGIFSRQT